MDNYNLLKSGNTYIDFTLQNYVNCFEALTAEDITKFTQLFDLLVDHDLKIGSKLIDHKSVKGICLNSTDEKKALRSTNDLSQQLSVVGKQVDINDKKEILFLQSITHLCDKLQYLRTEELIDLNYLFQTVINFKQSISDDTIKNGKDFFYPYKRYPKNNKKNK